MSEGKKGIFRRFQKVFWIVQSFELMERGAYYLMMPVLVYHAITNVKIPEGLALILPLFMYPIQYGVPIFSGALAEKWGYRKQMIFAFSVLSAAYFFLSFAFNSITMIIGVMLVGLGIGSYKPLISATIAKCTENKDRNIAYSVYYWTVNLAAAVFPVIWFTLDIFNVVNESMYGWVFRVGAVFLFLNVFIAIFVFREVPRSGKVKTARDALKNVRIAFGDKKFVVMVVLVGGFWALYSSFLNVLPVALLRFDFPTPAWVIAMAIGIFNPLTIITVGIPLAKFVERLQSMRAMMAGLLLYIIGLTVICYSLHFFYMVVAGIIIASIGEFMLAPGYYAFISKLAPKEKVSAYLGANFMATMIGLAGGTLVFGTLFNYIGIGYGRPRFFYGILISVGALLLIGFMVYYRSWGQDIIARAKEIARLEEGTEEGSEEKRDIKKREPAVFKIFDKKGTTVFALIVIPLVLFSTFSMGTNQYFPAEEDEEKMDFNIEDYDVIDGPKWSFEQFLNENGEHGETVEIAPEDGRLLRSVGLTLTWEDEPDQDAGPLGIVTLENQPDQFGMEISLAPDPEDDTTSMVLVTEDPVYNERGQVGRISVTLEFNHTKATSRNGTGTWEITVFSGNCGDYQGAVRESPDDGNDFKVEVITTYFAPEQV